MNELIEGIFDHGNFVVLDTETTGLHRPCEIIDIAILDTDGQTLYNSLLKPQQPVSEFITGLTGITNAMLEGQPIWPTVKSQIREILRGKDILTYNAKFDRHMMHCSDELWELGSTDYHEWGDWNCLMEAYAPHGGQWNDYYGNWKWIRLEVALERQGLVFVQDHRALGDAQAAYKLLHHMCNQ